MGEEAGNDSEYRRFSSATSEFRGIQGGQQPTDRLRAEIDYFSSLPPEVLEAMRDRFDKEEEIARGNGELSTIKDTEIAHDRREMARVVDSLAVGVEENRVKRGADYTVDGGPEGKISRFDVSKKEGGGVYYVLLAENVGGQIVGYYDFSCSPSFKGGESLIGSGTMMIDVSERNKGWGSALNTVARRMYQEVADKTGELVFRNESDRNASLGRPEEQKRWQRVFEKETFTPKSKGAPEDDSGLLHLNKKGTVLHREEVTKEGLKEEALGLRNRVIK